MHGIPKIAISGLIGALLCAVFGCLAFSLLAISDGTRPAEAFVYSLLVGLIGAFVGVFIGLAVGIGRFGVLGGGIAGALATLLIVALYVLSVGSYGRYAYFLRESSIIVVVLALPTIAAGILTALIVKRM
jgi:hypothetical protein